MKLQTQDLRYLLGENNFGEDGFQNILVYQRTFDMLKLKKAKILIMFLVGNQSGVYFCMHLTIVCNEIINVTDGVSTNATSTVSTDFRNEKVIYKMDWYIL